MRQGSGRVPSTSWHSDQYSGVASPSPTALALSSWEPRLPTASTVPRLELHTLWTELQIHPQRLCILHIQSTRRIVCKRIPNRGCFAVNSSPMAYI